MGHPTQDIFHRGDAVTLRMRSKGRKADEATGEIESGWLQICTAFDHTHHLPRLNFSIAIPKTKFYELPLCLPPKRTSIASSFSPKPMFEQAFKNIDDVLWKEAGCTTELDYTEQTSWLLFLKYLDGLEEDKATEAKLDGKKYSYILDKPYRWETWAAPKGKDGKLDHNTAMVPYPPLPEQQRIVRILDEAFEGIATAKANAEKNLKNAHALFESHLNSVFNQRGKVWVEKKLGDLSLINYGYTESASWEKVGPKFLRITDIQDNRVDWPSVPHCPIEASAYPKYKLADGDIVFARTGATTGKSYLVTSPPEAVFASYLIRVQLKTSELLPKFVNLFFQTRSYWDSIVSGISGSAQGGFNATKLGDLIIPFPQSPKEQKAIVVKLDELTEETQRLASIYERKLAALEALKKSLLHQAFTGAL